MTEKLLQFIWQFQYFNNSQLQTTGGEDIVLIQPGQLNKNQGPDFINARIKIGKTILAGSVELHIKTSDWYKHQHDGDENYKNVVLHVVYQNDTADFKLPVLELITRVPKIILDRYDSLMNNSAYIACERSLDQVKDIVWIGWKERLLAERLTRKSHNLYGLLQQNNYNWEEAFWWLLARTFGGKVNAEAFQTLASTLPLPVLARHKSSIHQVEALLLGQAGILHDKFEDSYAIMLYKEYKFLSKKYKLHPIQLPIHLLRMRPGNFPTIRLAQLAMLLHQSNHLLMNILDADSVEEVKVMLDVTANDYWHYRYRFDEPSPFQPKRVGDDMVNNILVNAAIPFMFCYGSYHKKDSYKIKALAWLEHTRAERNSITKEFARLHIGNFSAFDSQALLELKSQYCDVKRCLECSIGYSLLRSPEALPDGSAFLITPGSSFSRS